MRDDLNVCVWWWVLPGVQCMGILIDTVQRAFKVFEKQNLPCKEIGIAHFLSGSVQLRLYSLYIQMYSIAQMKSKPMKLYTHCEMYVCCCSMKRTLQVDASSIPNKCS